MHAQIQIWTGHSCVGDADAADVNAYTQVYTLDRGSHALTRGTPHPALPLQHFGVLKLLA